MVQFAFLDIEDLKNGQSDGKTSDAHKIESLERQLKEKDSMIEELLEQINQMKSTFHAWVERTEAGSSQTHASESSNGVGDHSELEEMTHVAKIPIKEDESYFTTYANLDIHYDMLSVSWNFFS